MSRRTMSELAAVYSKFMELKDNHTITECTKILNINRDTLKKWLVTPPSVPNFIDKSGSKFGKWYVVSYDGSQRYKCKCTVCNNIHILKTATINKSHDIRCLTCNPLLTISKNELIVALFIHNDNVTLVAEDLGFTNAVIYAAMRTHNISDSNTVSHYEFEFKEIGLLLDLDEKLVMSTYRSAIRKMVRLTRSKELQDFIVN